jgi:hypothetical protein
MSSRYQSAEEVEANYLKRLGTELGAAFYALHTETTWLFIKWEQFRTLYGTTPERIELLNEAAPLFFRVLQDSLWEDILLHISRLTDAPQSLGKTNLTIQGLPLLIGEPELREEVQVLVERAVEQSTFARDWRNRRLAHRDLALALKQSTRELTEASREKVQKAAEAIAATLNCISLRKFESTTGYEYAQHPGDATSLLYVLLEGTTSERRRRDRLRRGEYLPEDLAPPTGV